MKYYAAVEGADSSVDAQRAGFQASADALNTMREGVSIKMPLYPYVAIITSALFDGAISFSPFSRRAS